MSPEMLRVFHAVAACIIGFAMLWWIFAAAVAEPIGAP